MRNFVQPGNAVTAVAPSGGATAGAGVLIGKLFGIAATTEAAGGNVEIATVGVFDMAKAAVAVAAGDVIYFDESAGVVTTDDDSGANFRIGVAIAAAADSAATCRVRLDGAAT